MIAVHEPEGSVRGFQEDPSLVPDLQVSIHSRLDKKVARWLIESSSRWM